MRSITFLLIWLTISISVQQSLQRPITEDKANEAGKIRDVIDKNHYPWLETSIVTLIIALATFLALSVINYIHDKPPGQVNLLTLMYRDSFCLLLSWCWIGFLQILPVVTVRYFLPVTLHKFVRNTNRFLINVVLGFWIIVSGLKLTTSLSVKLRTKIDEMLGDETVGIWIVRCTLLVVVGSVQMILGFCGYQSPVTDGKSRVIGFIPEIVGTILLLAIELTNFILKKIEQRKNASKSADTSIKDSKAMISSIGVIVSISVAIFSLFATVFQLGFEDPKTYITVKSCIFELLFTILVSAITLFGKESIRRHVKNKNPWLGYILDTRCRNRITPIKENTA